MRVEGPSLAYVSDDMRAPYRGDRFGGTENSFALVSDADNSSSSVTDGELLSSMRYNATLGLTCLVVFGILNAVFKVYRIRLSLRRVTQKPPDLPKRHWSMLWMWIWRAVTVSDEQLLKTAGLDALMLVKTFGIGIQLFFPLAIVGCAVLIPIHEESQYADDQAYGAAKDRTQSVGRLVKLTASNVKPGSPSLWVHFFCVYAFILYAMLLLYWHLKRYVRLRHRYLSAGDEFNQWRTRHFPECPVPRRRLHHSSIFKKFVSKLFKEDVAEETIRKGLLTRLATLRRSDARQVFAQVDDTPRVPQKDSRSARSIPDNDLYQDICDGDSDKVFCSLSTARCNNAEITEETTESQPQISDGAPDEAVPSVPPESPQPPSVMLMSDNRGLWSASQHEGRFGVEGEERPWKWWLLRDGKTEIHSSAALHETHKGFHLPRPSVRYLKTINTEDPLTGHELAVNAQQYCVLLTNVPKVDTSDQG